MFDGLYLITWMRYGAGDQEKSRSVDFSGKLDFHLDKIVFDVYPRLSHILYSAQDSKQ